MPLWELRESGIEFAYDVAPGWDLPSIQHHTREGAAGQSPRCAVICLVMTVYESSKASFILLRDLADEATTSRHHHEMSHGIRAQACHSLHTTTRHTAMPATLPVPAHIHTRSIATKE